MALTLSHGGPTNFSSENESNTVLVGTQRGLVPLTRIDGIWHQRPAVLSDRHISAILIEPATSTIFAGAYEDSLHASTDGGKTWEERSSGLVHQNIYSLACRTLEDGTVVVYCGTEPAHLFESHDLGRSGPSFPACVRREASSTGTSRRRRTSPISSTSPSTRGTTT